MGQALSLLFAVLLLGGGPIAEDTSEDDRVQMEVETGILDAQADSDVLTGNASVDPKPSNAGEANDSARVNVTTGSGHAEAETTVGEGEVNVSLSPVEMSVRIADGEIVELTYTPPGAAEVLDDVETEHELVAEESAEGEPETTSQAAALDTDDEGVELSWAIAPAAGIAAAAAAGHAFPLGRWLRRLLGLTPAVPLFSRIEPDEMLEHEAREAIYEQLDEQAGLSLEALCRDLDLARSTARHHVRKLEQAGLIEHTRLGRSRVHHLVGQRHRAIREHLLTNETRHAVYETVEDEALTITEIAERIDANPGSVHFHLGKLEDVGLVASQGERGRRYRARTLDEDVLQSL